MRKFTLYILLFSLPLWVMVAVYVWFDPFKVIRTYSDYKAHSGELSVPLNQDHVSTSTFLFYNSSLHYNSFIFGSSHSMMYEVKAWETYLADRAVCYHFDASAESVLGIAHKVEFIHKQGNAMDNVLLVLDESIFQPTLLLSDHLYAEDPRLCGYANVIEFQSAHFLAFLNRKFLHAYLDYSFNAEVKPYMTENMVLDNRPFVYDPISNELRFESFEQLADGGKYYTAERMKSFYVRNGLYQESNPSIDSGEQALLQAMATIFENHQCDVRIIISPLYNQRTFSHVDKNLLQSIFGLDKVYDFSGVSDWTNAYSNYYERSHYRPSLSKAVLDSVYGKAIYPTEHRR